MTEDDGRVNLATGPFEFKEEMMGFFSKRQVILDTLGDAVQSVEYGIDRKSMEIRDFMRSAGALMGDIVEEPQKFSRQLWRETGDLVAERVRRFALGHPVAVRVLQPVGAWSAMGRDVVRDALDRLGTVEELVSDVMEAAESIVDAPLEATGGPLREAIELVGEQVERLVRFNQKAASALRPVSVCVDIGAGVVRDAADRLNTVVELQVELDAEHPFKVQSVCCASSTVRSDELLRVVVLRDRLVMNQSRLVALSEDGYSLHVRCLPFHELEVTLCSPDGQAKVTRFTLGVDEWSVGTGPHDERISLVRYRHRDFDWFEAPELTSHGSRCFRKLIFMHI